MKGQALGMIETMGLTALIAAADIAAKTADVEIHCYEKADAGIMTVYLYGDISSVKEAVGAGQETARSMGKLLRASVIPSPGVDFSQWIRGKRRLPAAAMETAPADASAEAPANAITDASVEAPANATTDASVEALTDAHASATVSEGEDGMIDALLELSAAELRSRVRGMPNLSLSRTEISKANKKTLATWLAEASRRKE